MSLPTLPAMATTTGMHTLADITCIPRLCWVSQTSYRAFPGFFKSSLASFPLCHLMCQEQDIHQGLLMEAAEGLGSVPLPS